MYSNLGGGRSVSRSRAAGGSGPGGSRPTRDEKIERGEQIRQREREIKSLHLRRFDPAEPPVAPPPGPLAEDEIRARHVAAALEGLGFFKRSARRDAKATAFAAAEEEISNLGVLQERERSDFQRQLDERWKRLLENDPEVVLPTLEAAFEDNAAPAAAVNLEGDEVSILMRAPSIGSVPSERYTITDAGNPSIRKRTKTDRVGYHNLLICGHVCLTLKETFAIAPSVMSARVVVVRADLDGKYSVAGYSCILATVVERQRFGAATWRPGNAGDVLNKVASMQRANQRGQVLELSPIPLGDEPDLRLLLEVVGDTRVGGGASG